MHVKKGESLKVELGWCQGQIVCICVSVCERGEEREEKKMRRGLGRERSWCGWGRSTSSGVWRRLNTLLLIYY